MVTLNIRKPARVAGIDNANQLVKATGLSLSAAYALWGEQVERIEFETLDVLCRVLGCQPGDILILRNGRRKK
jgi:DNA-binding Xre family transcriptional regulator